MGTKLEEIQAQIEAIQAAADNIAADITKLTDTITGGLTAAEAEGVVSKLTGIAENLKAISEITPEG